MLQDPRAAYWLVASTGLLGSDWMEPRFYVLAAAAAMVAYALYKRWERDNKEL